LAVLLPVLAFLFVITVDFARVFYYTQTIENCARNGALYAADPFAFSRSPYGSVSEAALADASNLSPQPTVNSVYGTDKSGNNYVDVTVTWTFTTITSFPGVPNPDPLTRTVRMRIAPLTPNSN
jgi:hypothetical protein